MEPVLHDDGDCPIGGGADVEQQVAAAAHNVDQHDDQFAAGVVVLEPLGAVVAVAEAHAAALFPGMVDAAHAGRVLGGPVAAVLVARVRAPAVVDDHIVFDRRLVEQPRQKLRACQSAEGSSHSPSLKMIEGL